MLKRLIGKIKKRYNEQLVINQLNSFSDYELRDIGITRFEIEDAVFYRGRFSKR